MSDANRVPTLSGTAAILQLIGSAGHFFQLESCPGIGGGRWLPVGAAKAGTGGTLTFTEPLPLPLPDRWFHRADRSVTLFPSFRSATSEHR